MILHSVKTLLLYPRMNNKELRLKITGDGSHTLFFPALNENYHSQHGAFTESRCVFIKNGLLPVSEKCKEINIFEVGFGTGLNAILAYQFIINTSHLVNYVGIEKNPLALEIISQLNYNQHWNNEILEEAFALMHQSEWGSNIGLDKKFNFKKVNASVLDYKIELNKYNIIFFDAFAPEKQPEMWNIDLFSKLYDALQLGGMLVTYCAKGQFKRDLKSVGFKVETLPGPPGKREMVRGIKI